MRPVATHVVDHVFPIKNINPYTNKWAILGRVTAKKDIRTYSRQAEELYEEAMASGVQFFNYDANHTPEEVVTAEGSFVEFYDHFGEHLGTGGVDVVDT